MAEKERIGLVLSGGGARGAYEIGVLSVLLPELERRGQRPNLLIGTSVGAINAAFLAGVAHRPAAEAVAAARERWLDISWEKVVRPVLGGGTARTVAQYAGAVAGIPGVRLQSLLDPAPLRGTLETWLDWEAVRRNVGAEALDGLALVTTSAESARSVVFWEGRGTAPVESSAEIEYVGADLGTDHVRASAAIPVAFPAIEIEDPEEWSGYYFDGGTRLNTPLKPALDFGDAAVQLLFAALVDSLINDVRMLAKVNLLVAGGAGSKAARYRRERGREPHREVPYMFIAPPARDRLGDIAAEVFHANFDRFAGFRRSPNLVALSRLLGGITPPHGELLSYLFFTPEFSSAAIEQGECDARNWLERDWGEDGPWLLEPLDALP